MTIDIKQLEILLERVTPGDFRHERFLVYALDEAEIQNRFSASVQRGVIRGQWRSGTRENTTDEELLANAELMSMSKTLARRVIAAEKLVNAVRDYRAKPETHIEEHVRTGLSYPEINAARMERSIKLANAVDESLSEWENMK